MTRCPRVHPDDKKVHKTAQKVLLSLILQTDRLTDRLASSVAIKLTFANFQSSAKTHGRCFRCEILLNLAWKQKYFSWWSGINTSISSIGFAPAAHLSSRGPTKLPGWEESACFIRTVQNMRELHWKLVFRCRFMIKRTRNDHRLPSLTDLFDLAANRKRLANKQQRLEWRQKQKREI